MDQQRNIVERLKSRLAEVRAMGFTIRLEVLDDEEPAWCEIGGIPTLFVDLTQTAVEQLRQIDEILAAYQNHVAARAGESADQRAA